ncbi:MAG: primase, partial [Solirubrobacterales bacterium]|nr:primase [Solirubrobacterales bacterium]
ARPAAPATTPPAPTPAAPSGEGWEGMEDLEPDPDSVEPSTGGHAPAPVAGTGHRPSPAAGPPAALPPLPDGPHARTERALLVQVVARPDVGRAALREMGGPDVFSAGVHRRAVTHLLAHDGPPAAHLPEDDAELASLMAGLLVRAGEQSSDADALKAEVLKLRLAAVERQMKVAAGSGSADMPALARERQGLQAAVREAIGRHMDAAANDS